MEIAKLGEFGLIDHLTNGHELKNKSSLKGVGDDCAVIASPTTSEEGNSALKVEGARRVSLVTTDMLMEGVHFDLTYIGLEHLGYKSAMVNISDIFAMNGRPEQMVVSIALSKRFQVEDMEAFYRGLRRACDKWNVDIVGGDTTSSLTGLAISITCIGTAKEDEVVYRSGAKDTDLICVSGDLGAAYMGLQILEREKAVYYDQLRQAQKKAAQNSTNERSVLDDSFVEFQPDFSGKEYLLERQLKPEARGDILEKLRSFGIKPTSMIDISDGLSSEIRHICKQSNCGCRIYENNLPIDYQTAVTAEEFEMNVTTCALNGGEDYELLFTIPIGDLQKIEQLDDIHMIGYITKPELGTQLIARDNQEFELKAQGWQHC